MPLGSRCLLSAGITDEGKNCSDCMQAETVQVVELRHVVLGELERRHLEVRRCLPGAKGGSASRKGQAHYSTA